MLTELPPRDRGDRPPPLAGASDNADHPMRRVTESVVADPSSWTSDRAVEVAAVFDQMAPDWHERSGSAGHLDALDDALDRGAVGGGRAVDLGAGTGIAGPTLVRAFDSVVAIDLSLEMLRRAPTHVPRVQADSAHLPLPAGSVDVVVLVNAFLFAAEVDRVLALGGAVVWVSSIGARTPIHLPAADVLAALPGQWDALTARCGEGTWCVLRRRGR